MKNDNQKADHPYFQGYEKVKDDGQTIQIRDVWLALKTSLGILFASAVIAVIAGFMVSVFDVPQFVTIIIGAIFFIPGLIFTIRVWNSYNQGIIVSSKYDKINIPASDVENTFLDIISLKRLRDLANRIEFSISEIDKVWVDRQKRTVTYTDRSGKKPKTKTKTIVVYTVNIAGPFGSQNIEYTSRQKRDEFRSAISMCAKDLGLSLRVGSNVDMQG